MPPMTEEQNKNVLNCPQGSFSSVGYTYVLFWKNSFLVVKYFQMKHLMILFLFLLQEPSLATTFVDNMTIL